MPQSSNCFLIINLGSGQAPKTLDPTFPAVQVKALQHFCSLALIRKLHFLVCFCLFHVAPSVQTASMDSSQQQKAKKEKTENVMKWKQAESLLQTDSYTGTTVFQVKTHTGATSVKVGS